MNNKIKTYLKLFKSTFYLSAFTIGGGYVIVPLMQKKFVEDLKLIDEKEMLDIVCIAQSTPGAIAINTAILVGYKVSGVIGALICTFATILPPLIIISIICMFYDAFKSNNVIAVFLKAARAVVSAIIVNVVINLAKDVFKEGKIFSIALMVIVFLVNFYFNINVIFIIISCALLGIIYTYFLCKTDSKVRNGDKR